jgi:VIT1/CCC1 family predicted Fe2+/Mn2+ transporter
MTHQRDGANAIDSWRQEQEAAYLYRILADVEPLPQRQQLFRDLHAEAEQQSGVWAQQVRAAGLGLPDFQPSLRARTVAAVVRVIGIKPLLPALAAMKVRGLSVYRGAVQGHPMPTVAGPEPYRHRAISQGGTLRAAVFGANDGLVSNASLILGVAGASTEPRLVLLTGIAGLLAGAFSMAAGEYVSVRSQTELFERQIGLEREELALYPAEEAAELALIYQARGIPADDAHRIATRLIADPAHALDTLAREELGLNPDELGSPWAAGFFSFVSFAAGGFIPLLPFLLLPGPRAVPWTAAISVVALFAIGASLSLFTGRNAWWSGLRMVLIGGSAAGVTFAVGRLLGVTLS